MTPSVETVLGSISTSELGFTLSHEHVVVSSAGIPHIYPEFIARDNTIKESISILKKAKSNGIDTIIDVTTIDLGRDIHLLKHVSKESGINIVCATGTWRDIPRAFWAASIDSIKSLYVKEIKQGIENTQMKAGIIKVANDSEGITQEGEIILRAAARAHMETGAPISTHTWAPKKIGNDQINIFLEEGVDLNRVYIGHSNDSTDIGYLKGANRIAIGYGKKRAGIFCVGGVCKEVPSSNGFNLTISSSNSPVPNPLELAIAYNFFSPKE